MRYLSRSVPAKWVAVALLALTVAVAVRARDVVASMNDAEAKIMLDRAHEAYARGQYERAMNYAHEAAVIAPESADVLVSASDYAFVLGMSRFTPSQQWHLGDFNTGIYYSSRAHKVAPDDVFVHREWAEGLLLAHLYEVPVNLEQVHESWKSLPVDNPNDSAYRETALRIVSNQTN